MDAAIRPATNRGLILPIYATTLCLSAALMFCVQPMFAKLVLPLFGGAPAVWNTAMVFFQATLLAGYAYAHLISRRLAPRAQLAVHGLVLIAAFISLPLAIPAGSEPPAEGSPIFWLVLLLAGTLASPFFALSATAPLLQRWFSRTDHPAARDPYFLYSASNIGSLVGLLGYPLLLEPLLGAGQQTFLWAVGFVAFALAIITCGVMQLRFTADSTERDAELSATTPAVTARDRLWWVLLALVPSSLLLGVTTYITTDLASVPLLWAVPLAIYLLSFIIAFARRPVLKHTWMLAAQPFLIVAVVASMALTSETEPVWSLALHLLAFFVTATVCHGELARLRPDARDLTEFYLLISLGGVLGGMFNALAAPLLFTSAHEYMLALVAACLLRPATAAAPADRWAELVLPLVLAVFLLALPLTSLLGDDNLPPAVIVFVTFLLAACASRPLRFGLGIAAVLVLSPYRLGSPAVLAAERSFFGIYKVVMSEDENTKELWHGTTVHGAEFVEPRRWREPLTYYHHAGPFGSFFAARSDRQNGRIGVAGLGTGALACYARPGESWRFYEIDPAMVRLARDNRHFHYLSECGGQAEVVLGDARLSLKAAPDESLDVLVLDAFSSDAIPIHLLTREAVQLYMRKLAPGGVLLFHLSNRYFRLAPLVSRLAGEEGLAARYHEYWPDGEAEDDGAYAVELMAVARQDQVLSFLDGKGGWAGPPASSASTIWTDDHSDILSVLKWSD